MLLNIFQQRLNGFLSKTVRFISVRSTDESESIAPVLEALFLLSEASLSPANVEQGHRNGGMHLAGLFTNKNAHSMDC